MRFVLTLLAVIGLLASPAAAAAAEAACHEHGQGQMMDMAMPGMPGMAQADAHKAAPCCDPAKGNTPSKQNSHDCMQACAVMCGVVAALPAAPAVALLGTDHESPMPARVASLKPHEPSRLERPPKSIA